MTGFRSIVRFFFDRLVLQKPAIIIVCILAATGFFVFEARNFKLDASAETLLLENDENLKFSRLIASRYSDSDMLVLTFKPRDDLFSYKTLGQLARIRDDLKALDSVESVMTILDVPLLQSPPVPLKEMGSTVRTLESMDVNRAMAMNELRESPLYKNLLVSPDLKTTAILITFPRDQKYEDLRQRRDILRDKLAAGELTASGQVEFKEAVKQFTQYRDQGRRQRHNDIIAIRSIMNNYRSDGSLFLGGMSMIADDMISFIKSDLRIFGAIVFLLLVLVIAVIFRRTYWVILPMLVCAVSVIWTVGFLGLFGWEVTVISSNFISLQLIITLAMTIHLMVRYREFSAERPEATHRELIFNTIHAMFIPCVYSGLTTIFGFASLIFCNIRPIISFGYIMVVGVTISIIVPFLLLPAVLVLLPKDKPVPKRNTDWAVTPMLGRFTVSYGPLIVIASFVLLAVNFVGIRRLQVENCFIDYFKPSTEIHQGMELIDRSLGGTTPMDVVLDFAPKDAPQAAAAGEGKGDGSFEEFGEFDKQASDPKYWFTPEKMDRIRGVHDYLEDLPQTGKVLSIVTLVRMVESANGGKKLDNVEMALLFDKIPERLRQMLVKPYVSVENNQVRISVRVIDSDRSLKRNDLLKKIQNDLTGRFAFAPEQVHLAGALVLYNNMLQSLYTSQVVTMGLATLSLMVVFVILFRSLRIACIAIFPNILAVSCVLGVMGWLNIPLDMMTITIAAIGVGLADDDTIHYIHRFRHELESSGSYITALEKSHDSIGHAIYYTTITLVIGFSILCLSNFIPTIYFGMFTVLAITVALFASLTLLPQLLVLLKPYGKNNPGRRAKFL